MNVIVTLSPADIDTTVNHEPRIEDRKLGAALGMARATNIRQTIEENREELEGFEDLHSERANPGKLGGRPSVSYWLNEPQALLLCMFAKTERAAEVRRQIIDVFMAVSGMPSKSWRLSRMESMATPAMPTSPATRGWSLS